MGKGDRKTKLGKIFLGSFGNCRPRKKKSRVRQIPSPLPCLPPPGPVILPLNPAPVHPRPGLTPPPDPVIPSPDKSKFDSIVWFQPKAYTHLGEKLTLKDEKWVESKVKDVSWVSKYCFYPLLHRNISQRRFKKCTNGKKAHFDLNKKKPTAKQRHIFYANHLDSAIYSYYSKVVLGGKYEQILAENPELSPCISAYRSIKVNEQSNKGKSNIHFAKEAFDYIKGQSECVALAFDITGFFDNLNHVNLKKAWMNLLKPGQEKLDDDHFNIFQALTKFTYIEEIHLLKLHGLQAIKNRKKLNRELEKIECFCKGSNGKQKAKYFKNLIAPKFIVPHSEYEHLVNGGGKGIPQGTPISALLANIYLFEFDKKVFEKLNSMGGFYRRYSDDIMVVCPRAYEEEVTAFVMDLISSKDFMLEINPTKTQKSYFTKDNSNDTLTANTPIAYLGFEFNGKRTLLKSSAISKYHRRKKYFVKRKVHATQNMIEFRGPDSNLWESEIWRKYSSKGRRNFLAYVQRAHDIMNEKAILRQVRRHKQKLSGYILKQRIHNDL